MQTRINRRAGLPAKVHMPRLTTTAARFVIAVETSASISAIRAIAHPTKFVSALACHMNTTSILLDGGGTFGTGLGIELHPGLVVIYCTLRLHALFLFFPFSARVAFVPRFVVGEAGFVRILADHDR